MKFRATVRATGKNSVAIAVPPEVVERIGAGKNPPVRVTINGYTYRSTLAILHGVFRIGADAREKAGVTAGEEIDVEMEHDTEPRKVSVPPAFAEALQRNPEAGSAFEGLSYSNKLRMVLPMERTKADETRQRLIEKALNMLEKGKP